MTDLGLGLGEYSVLLTINGGMLCLLQIPAMKLFARMGNSRVLVMGLAVTVIGYAVQAAAHSWGGFALAVVLWTLGELGTFLSPPLRLPPWHPRRRAARIRASTT